MGGIRVSSALHSPAPVRLRGKVVAIAQMRAARRLAGGSRPAVLFGAISPRHSGVIFSRRRSVTTKCVRIQFVAPKDKVPPHSSATFRGTVGDFINFINFVWGIGLGTPMMTICVSILFANYILMFTYAYGSTRCRYPRSLSLGPSMVYLPFFYSVN
eukprot:4953387-Pyramimonas_sp.AAC.1